MEDEWDEVKPILSSWCEFQKDYKDFFEEDVAYWYNESANVSAVVSAANKCPGVVAIAETSEARIKGSTGFGRIDAYIGFASSNSPPTTEVWGLYLEAKMLFVQLECLGAPEPSIQGVQTKLSNAILDLSGIGNDCPGMAACFFVPSFATCVSPTDEEVLELVAKVKKIEKLHAIAWFAPGGEVLKGSDMRFYPLVFIAASFCNTVGLNDR